jgi:hypothetical protein
MLTVGDEAAADKKHKKEPAFIVRGLPAWEELEPPVDADVAPYVREYCYDAADEDTWVTPPDSTRGPILELEVKGHEELQGHTWSFINCSLSVRLESHTGSIGWQVPRRLAQLREDLHMPIKSSMGEHYSKYFANAPFARSLGLPGTTDRLRGWCRALASCISSGGAPPAVVARVIYFLDTPEPECFLTDKNPFEADTPAFVMDDRVDQSCSVFSQASSFEPEMEHFPSSELASSRTAATKSRYNTEELASVIGRSQTTDEAISTDDVAPQRSERID